MKKLIYVSLLLFFGSPIVGLAQSDSLHIDQLQIQIDSLKESQYNLSQQIEDIHNAQEDYRSGFAKSIEEIQDDQNQLDSLFSSLNEQFRSLTQETNRLERTLSASNNRIDELNSIQDELQSNTTELRSDLGVVTEELESKIEETSRSAEEQITTLDQTVSQNTIYWIIAVITAMVLAIVLFFILKRRMKSDDHALLEKISSTKKELEEEGLKLDQKLMEVLNSQMKVLEQSKEPESGENDHSLALKIADEVTRIRMNLDHMDQSTKGWKQLDRSARAIMNNFKANGYELPELLGKEYDEGMNVIATTEIDENLNSDQKIIKRVVKPQVNFDGKMIQPAQIVVATGI